jgi:hypothetical protein
MKKLNFRSSDRSISGASRNPWGADRFVAVPSRTRTEFLRAARVARLREREQDCCVLTSFISSPLDKSESNSCRTSRCRSQRRSSSWILLSRVGSHRFARTCRSARSIGVIEKREGRVKRRLRGWMLFFPSSPFVFYFFCLRIFFARVQLRSFAKDRW